MTAPRYRLVIFDFGGTVADSFGWCLDVFDAVADRFGFRRLERDRIDHLRGLSTRELLHDHGVPMWKVPMIAAHARRLQGRDLDAICVFPGMGEVITGLKAHGVTLALVSSNAHGNIARIMGPEMTAAFDHVSSGAVGWGYALPERLRRERPDHFFETPSQITDLFHGPY